MRKCGAVLAVASVVAAAAALTGCGGDDQPSKPQATVTVTDAPSATSAEQVESTDEATETASAGREPDVGERALKVGQWREGLGLRTRVIEVRQPTADGLPSYLRDLPDASGAAVLVRSCVRKGQAESYWATTSSFVARDRSGGVYESASSSWEEWPPRPQYPFEREVRAGQCVQGWILLSAPNGTRIVSVELSDDEGGATAEWLV